VLAYKNDKFSSKNISHCGISSGQDQDQCTALEGTPQKKRKKARTREDTTNISKLLKIMQRPKEIFEKHAPILA